MTDYKVSLLEYPNDDTWMEIKRRALVTVGKKPVNAPDLNWRKKILKARHSPIRYAKISFYLEVPYWLSVHLCRHVHAQPYVKSQRNDRQSEYDRNSAPQNQIVCMIFDVNAEEMITIANKRLCGQASFETREVVQEMCNQLKAQCPEFADELVPMCVRDGGVCHEMYPCGKNKTDFAEDDLR